MTNNLDCEGKVIVGSTRKIKENNLIVPWTKELLKSQFLVEPKINSTGELKTSST